MLPTSNIKKAPAGGAPKQARTYHAVGNSITNHMPMANCTLGRNTGHGFAEKWGRPQFQQRCRPS